MRAHADHVIGVDVAPGMRSLATARAEQLGLSGLEFTDTIPSGGAYRINSLIVFQHTSRNVDTFCCRHCSMR